MSKEDNIYATPHSNVEPFRFDEQVANVFPDMIQRSVPGYSTIIDMMGVLAGRYAQPNTHIYDLGCSLGAATLCMRQHIPHQDCQIHAIDNSPAMLDKAAKHVAMTSEQTKTSLPSITWQCEDICHSKISNASVVAMNFTLQFIAKKERDGLIKRIADGLNSNGVFLLSEKIHIEDEQEDHLQQALHYAFKRGNGYSDLEIAQKRSAIEEVLIPETLETHKQRLLKAGFSNVYVWFQCFNFISLVAIK